MMSSMMTPGLTPSRWHVSKTFIFNSFKSDRATVTYNGIKAQHSSSARSQLLQVATRSRVRVAIAVSRTLLFSLAA